MLYVAMILVFVFGLVIPATIAAFALFEIRSGFLGAPYVPTNAKLLDEILKGANLKKGNLFVELGSGDGRVVRTAVLKYGVKGLGIELNPLLVLFSTLLAYLRNLRDIKFKRQNFFDTDLKDANTLFLFLLPKTLLKLRPKLEKECRKSLIISHGFEVKGWEKFLVKKQKRKIFPTYFYKIS